MKEVFYSIDTNNGSKVFFMKHEQSKEVHLICDNKGSICYDIPSISYKDLKDKKSLLEKIENEFYNRCIKKSQIKFPNNIGKNFKLVDTEGKRTKLEQGTGDLEDDDRILFNRNQLPDDNKNTSVSQPTIFDLLDPRVARAEIFNYISKKELLELVLLKKETFMRFKNIYLELVYIKMSSFFVRTSPSDPQKIFKGDVELVGNTIFSSEVLNLIIDMGESYFDRNKWQSIEYIKFSKFVDYSMYNTEKNRMVLKGVVISACTQEPKPWNIVGIKMIFKNFFNKSIDDLPNFVKYIDMSVNIYSPENDITELPPKLVYLSIYVEKLKPIMTGKKKLRPTLETAFPETLLVLSLSGSIDIPNIQVFQQLIPKNLLVLVLDTDLREKNTIENGFFLPRGLKIVMAQLSDVTSSSINQIPSTLRYGGFFQRKRLYQSQDIDKLVGPNTYNNIFNVFPYIEYFMFDRKIYYSNVEGIDTEDNVEDYTKNPISKVVREKSNMYVSSYIK